MPAGDLAGYFKGVYKKPGHGAFKDDLRDQGLTPEQRAIARKKLKKADRQAQRAAWRPGAFAALTNGDDGGGGGGGGDNRDVPYPSPPDPTPPGPFPTDRDPSLDPNNFDPSLGAPPARGIDFGTSPFSQMLEGGISGIVQNRGAPLSGFAGATREAIGANLAQLMDQKGRVMEAGPGTAEFEVGQDSDVQEALSGILQAGPNVDVSNVERRLESVREMLDRERRRTTSAFRARNAGRGQGIGQDRTSASRLESEHLAPQFATAFRDIVANELDASRGTFNQALGLGESAREFDEGISFGDLTRRDEAAQRESEFQRGSEQQERFGAQADITRLLDTAQGAAGQDQAALLAALGLGSDRQGMLSDIALSQIGLDAEQSRFLADHGMRREGALEGMTDDRLMQMLSVILPMLQASGRAAGGAV
jgi:hypothetical protein